MRPGDPDGAARRAGARRHAGSTFLVLMIAIAVLSILGTSLSYIFRQRSVQVNKRVEDMKATALAEAGIHHALFRLRNVLHGQLVTPRKPTPETPQRVNEELLAFFDAERARDWARTFSLKDDKLGEGGEASVLMELLQVSRIDLGTYIDRVEVIPRGLEQYRERKKEVDGEDEDTFGMMPLGGWVGKLRISSTGTYRSSRTVIEEVRDVKVLDITPPASDHTLFIEGEATEEIRQGRFVLSNLNLPFQIRDLLFDLGNKVNEHLRLDMSEDKGQTVSNIDKIVKMLTNEVDEGDMQNALKLVHEISKSASDENIQDTVDNIILSLDPRDWGRVRTNGVLYVYMPFFAADDIINYFASDSYFGHQRPEVGYLFCENRLHDPYLSVYTHYEGYLYKHYQRLNPVILGPTDAPQPVPPQRYTINTRPDYVRRYPERKDMPNLARLRELGRRHAHRVVRRKAVLRGTDENPLELRGIWYFTEDVTIGGPFTGRGVILCDKTITVLDDLTRDQEGDSLSLVSLKGSVALDPSKQFWRLQSGICSVEGLVGTRMQDVQLFGNLAVVKLNREQMPRYFTCRFDPDLKNHMADNVVGVWSREPILRRDLGASAEVSPLRAGVSARDFEE